MTKLVFILMILMCFLAGCRTETPLTTALAETSISETAVTGEEIKAMATGYYQMTGQQAYDYMQQHHEYLLLDVRTHEEFARKHISGAHLIPDYELAERAPQELLDKDQVILVYCRSGRRSALAAQALVGLGYTNVYDFGGILDWNYETAGQ